MAKEKHKNKHHNHKVYENNIKNNEKSLKNEKKNNVKIITTTNNNKDNNNNNNNNSKNMSKLSLLQQKFAKKLDGARFRLINEELYTRFQIYFILNNNIFIIN